MGRLRLICALLAFLVTAQAQRQMTVAELTAFIQSSVKLRHPDRDVADFVRKIKLTNRLDERTVEQLQGTGVGPRTLAALRELSAASAKLPAPPPPEPPTAIAKIPPPDSIEEKKILAAITQNALYYTKNLPNFICVQVTKRYADPLGQENWRLLDVIQERLSFFERHEDYKVMLYNNQQVPELDHNKLGGTTSSGEFGTMLDRIFSPSSHTEFEWGRWATLRGQRMYVFDFRVLQRYSDYHIIDVTSGRSVVVGYHGLVYADRDSNMVMRMQIDCDGIPADFPMRRVSIEMNYQWTEIADQKFVLPLQAVLRSDQGRVGIKNEVQFTLYRKFGTDTTITFDPVADIPEDQLKEQPPTPVPAKK